MCKSKNNPKGICYVFILFASTLYGCLVDLVLASLFHIFLFLLSALNHFYYSNTNLFLLFPNSSHIFFGALCMTFSIIPPAFCYHRTTPLYHFYPTLPLSFLYKPLFFITHPQFSFAILK